MASLEVFTSLFSALIAAFPTATADPATTAQVFFLALQDIPDVALSQAVAEWLAHGHKFPTIADLRELALAEQYPLPSEAWGEVKRAFARYGRARKPQFSHPLIAQTVDDLGWESLCASQVADEPIVRAQFTRAYRERVGRETFNSTALAAALKTIQASERLQDETK